MALRSSSKNRDKRLLLPVARDMMKACCPRYLRSVLDEASMDAESEDSGEEEAVLGLNGALQVTR